MKEVKKIFFIITLTFIFIFMITGCKKEEVREVELNKTFEISKNETVKIDGNDFTIARLGNTSCKRGSSSCVFDGLKVEYIFKVGKKSYTKRNIEDSDYIVNIGKTDYKNFVEITIQKKSS